MIERAVNEHKVENYLGGNLLAIQVAALKLGPDRIRWQSTDNKVAI